MCLTPLIAFSWVDVRGLAEPSFLVFRWHGGRPSGAVCWSRAGAFSDTTWCFSTLSFPLV